MNILNYFFGISPVSTGVMITHFDRACHIKQYFTHAARRLAAAGGGSEAHIEEAAVTLDIKICISVRTEM